MKQIIKGKLYNTDTAREVGCHANAGNWRDFGHIEETLYCKRTGEYFLHGKGGPMTRYAEQVESNSWSGGAKIIPMNYADARQWAQENLSTDEYEQEFGQVAEDDTTTVISISMPTVVVDKARRAAQAAGMTLSAYIASLIG